MDRMLKAKKREGSVLLQTLVMCVILSFIAVSLTRWALGRYSAVNKTYTDAIFNGVFMRSYGNYYSQQASQMSSGHLLGGWVETGCPDNSSDSYIKAKTLSDGTFQYTYICTIP